MRQSALAPAPGAAAERRTPLHMRAVHISQASLPRQASFGVSDTAWRWAEKGTMALLHSREQDPLAVRVHQRAGVAVHDGRLCAHGGARWCRGQARLSGSSSHAAPRLWRCAGQQGPRYASVAGLPRPPQHSANRALYRVVAGQVHGLLALTDMAGLDTGSTRSRGPLAEISLACWQFATQPNPPLSGGPYRRLELPMIRQPVNGLLFFRGEARTCVGYIINQTNALLHSDGLGLLPIDFFVTFDDLRTVGKCRLASR